MESSNGDYYLVAALSLSVDLSSSLPCLSPQDGPHLTGTAVEDSPQIGYREVREKRYHTMMFS